MAVQLPARVTGLAGKYASALYIAGYKANALDQIDDDLIEVNTPGLFYALRHRDRHLLISRSHYGICRRSGIQLHAAKNSRTS